MSKKQLGLRLLQMLVVLIGISFLTFLLTYMAPGDPVRTMYAATGVIPSEEVLNEVREQMGLNDPFFVQYGRWLTNCLHGDFGNSYAYGKPVVSLLLARLWPTLKLALFSTMASKIPRVSFGCTFLPMKSPVFTM